MPTRRVELQLLRQFARNPQLPRKTSDLNDWVYLGLAVSYCNVVVAERQFTDLISRNGFAVKATVVSSLDDLPRV